MVKRAGAVRWTWLLPLGGFLLLSLAYGVLNPIWEALDEPEHFQYVKFIAEQHRLPNGDETLPALVDRPANELFQPPLYYVLEAPFVAGIDLNANPSWVRNPYFTWAFHPLRNGVAIHTLSEAWPYRGMILGAHVMRVVSTVLCGVAVACVYWIGYLVSSRRGVGLMAASLAALTPGFIISSASIDNDAAAIATSSVALLVAVRLLWARHAIWLWFAGLGLATGLALLAQPDNVVLLAVGILAAILVGLRERSVRLLLIHVASFVLATGLTAGWHYALSSSHSTGSYLSQNILNLEAVRQTLTLARAWGIVRNVYETYWGSFGWEIFHLPPLFYWLLLPPCLLSAMSLLWHLRGRQWGGESWRTIAVRPEVGGRLLLMVAIGLGFLTTAYWNLARSDEGATAHARFLFPVIAGTSFFLICGLCVLRRGLREASLGYLFAACAATTGYALAIAPGSFGPVAPVYGDARAAGVQRPLNVDFANGMQLVGILPMGPEQVTANGDLHLRLLWQAAETPAFDYSAFLRLQSAAGQVIHDQDHGPGASLNLLPHDWQPGEVIPDDWTIHIPAGAAPGDYRIEAGLYDYRDLKPISASGGQPAAVIGQARVAS